MSGQSKKDSRLIPVEIFGQTYNVRGEEEGDYIEELARYVDAKMKSISESTGTTDSLKIAILAALNIADEFFKLETKHRESQDRMAQRAAEMIEALEQALKEDAGGAVA